MISCTFWLDMTILLIYNMAGFMFSKLFFGRHKITVVLIGSLYYIVYKPFYALHYNYFYN